VNRRQFFRRAAAAAAAVPALRIVVPAGALGELPPIAAGAVEVLPAAEAPQRIELVQVGDAQIAARVSGPGLELGTVVTFDELGQLVPAVGGRGPILGACVRSWIDDQGRAWADVAFRGRA
jgi:hypothetical protein